jgi:hypothetical protein
VSSPPRFVGYGPASGELLTGDTQIAGSDQGPRLSLPDDDQSRVTISTNLAMVFMLRAVPAFPAGMRRRESAIPLP